ncbi:hypothetical protein G9P44_004957 [Scheffersomyces stipitis]|nr:hypothetical protein G9P44_004957 [Scheffersomyces stipitis]
MSEDNAMKRPASDSESSSKKPKLDHDENDQLNDLFADTLPDFDSKHHANEHGEDLHSNPLDFGTDPLAIDFDNIPSNLLEALPAATDNINNTSNSNNSNNDINNNNSINNSNNINNVNVTSNISGSGSGPLSSNVRATPNATTSSSSSFGKSASPLDGKLTEKQSVTPIKTEVREGDSLLSSSVVNRPLGPSTAVHSSTTVPTTSISSGNLAGQVPAPVSSVSAIQFPQSTFQQNRDLPSVSSASLADTKEKQLDPSKLNDAIAAAGVDIQREEELLTIQQTRTTDVSRDLRQFLRSSKPPAFLNPYHVASFMNRVARENGVQQNFLQDGDLLELMSASCEMWLSSILGKTVLLSRHRRRGIPQPTNAKNGKKASSNANSAPRSELSKELRNLAVRQKELEERRISKRIMLGLEKNGADPDGDQNGDSKAGAEETLHRAANATAAMMTMKTGVKKYSWMTSTSSAGADTAKAGADTEKGKQSALLSVRGDNGLRFREIRSGNTITMKDILGAIEGERMGTQRAIIKGYAKLKD